MLQALGEVRGPFLVYIGFRLLPQLGEKHFPSSFNCGMFDGPIQMLLYDKILVRKGQRVRTSEHMFIGRVWV